MECKNCRWWQIQSAYHEGLCRKNAPIRTVKIHQEEMDSQFLAVWPETKPEDWCGDWELKIDNAQDQSK